MGVLIGATLFVTLFTVMLTTLRRAEAFSASADVTLAICASLLAVVGIAKSFAYQGGTVSTSGRSWLDVIVLPYTAMGIAMLLVLLLLLLREVVPGRDRTSGASKRGIRRESPAHAAAGDGHRERHRKV